MPEPDASTHLSATICISAGRLRNSHDNWRFRATLRRGAIEALFELFNYLLQDFGQVRVERDIRKCLMDLVQHSIAFREGDVLRSHLLYSLGRSAPNNFKEALAPTSLIMPASK